MELNSNLWYIKFYLFLHNKAKYQLPNDICSLRNQLIKTFLLFIIIAPLWITGALMAKWTGESDDINPWKVLGVNLVLAPIVFLGLLKTIPAIETITSINFTILILSGTWYIGPVIFATVFFLVVFTLYLILVAIIDAYKNIKRKKVSENKTPGLIKTMYKSWRDKYCTKITWR